MIETALLIGLIAKFGPVVINEVVSAWKRAGEPTPEEIADLAKRVPPPEHYFPDLEKKG